MTDFGKTPDGEATRVLLHRTRALFAAQGDEWGVHLCEIALARIASDPIETLSVLLSPLSRLATTRTLNGLDAIVSEVLIAARALGAQDLEARVRALVASVRSLELNARVFSILWDRVQVLVETGDVRGGLNAGWAALELAVALEDSLAAAVSLVRIAGCHEALSSDPSSRDARAAALCVEQAARYLMRCGYASEAGDLFREAARFRSASLDPSSPSPHPETRVLLEEAIRAYEEAGVRDRVAECRIEVARGYLDAGRPREAIRMLHKALSQLEGPESLAIEVQGWTTLAEAYRRAGDLDSAVAAETRARLLRDAMG